MHKEKAKELVDTFFTAKRLYDEISWEQAKTCATTCVDEIIAGIKRLDFACHMKAMSNDLMFWDQVKEEIGKL